MTPAKCQEAVVSGKTGPVFSSSVLSVDGTLQCESGDSSTLETDPQMALPRARRKRLVVILHHIWSFQPCLLLEPRFLKEVTVLFQIRTSDNSCQEARESDGQ